MSSLFDLPWYYATIIGFLALIADKYYFKPRRLAKEKLKAINKSRVQITPVLENTEESSEDTLDKDPFVTIGFFLAIINIGISLAFLSKLQWGDWEGFSSMFRTLFIIISCIFCTATPSSIIYKLYSSRKKSAYTKLFHSIATILAFFGLHLLVCVGF